MLHHMLRAAAGRDRVPTDGLVAWYTMDNISGSTLVDEVGNYDGTITGATQTTGIIGQALSFDGNDYVSSSPVLSADCTFSLWVNQGLPSSTMFSLTQHGDFAEKYRGLFFSGGDLIATTRDSGANSYNTSTINIDDGSFRHAVFVQSGSVASLYVDGSLHDSVDAGSTYTYQSAITMGRRPGLNDIYYDGLIDQVRLYDRALSGTEIMQLYNEGA